jgi:hypothetical protein
VKHQTCYISTKEEQKKKKSTIETQPFAYKFVGFFFSSSHISLEIINQMGPQKRYLKKKKKNQKNRTLLLNFVSLPSFPSALEKGER